MSDINPFVPSVNLAKEALLEGRRKLLRQLERLDRIIAAIDADEKRSGLDIENLPPVRASEYRGMRAMDALESYLRVRRGFKIPLPRAVMDLVEGGVDPGQPRGSKSDPAALVAHTLKIGVPNKPDLFGYSPDSVSEKTGAHVIPKGTADDDITLWLADTADRPKRRKRSD